MRTQKGISYQFISIVSLLRTVMTIASSPAPGQDVAPPRHPSWAAPLFP
jgi:hypothetical protein